MPTFTTPFGPDNFGKVCDRYTIRLKYSREDNELFYKLIGLLPFKREPKKDSWEIKFEAFLVLLKLFFQTRNLENFEVIKEQCFKRYSERHAEFLELKNNPRLICMLNEFKENNAEFKF
ncbi:MAG: hypothetical protein JWM20_736 [Patescibacteria group bacterium]|nr:hypothetical protein [Patescibacteria group bacterium]